MDLAAPGVPATVPNPEGISGPIGRVESRLLALDAGIRAAARHSARISWYAWGFLFAAFTGPPVAEVAFVYESLRSGGGPVPVGALAVGALPAVGLLAFALGELWSGIVESRRDRAGPMPTRPSGEGAPIGLSLVTVQEDQKEISRVRGELEVSMIPLVLGGITLIEYTVALTLVGWYPGFGGLSVVYLPVIPVVFIIPFIWLVWRAARRWVGRYQKGLDDQVREMVALEGEFLGRFASGPARE